MTPKLLRAKKNSLEIEIRNLIKKFKKETGFEIVSISYNKLYGHKVYVDIENI